MNRFLAIGRIVNDPEVRYGGSNNTCLARYTLAVQRSFKNAQGNYDADFINCQAIGKSGEFAEKYLHKGMKVAIEGEIRTGSYEKDGRKVYTTDVVVNSHEFVESKAERNDSAPAIPSNEFMAIPDGLDEELPFS